MFSAVVNEGVIMKEIVVTLVVMNLWDVIFSYKRFKSAFGSQRMFRTSGHLWIDVACSRMMIHNNSGALKALSGKFPF